MSDKFNMGDRIRLHRLTSGMTQSMLAEKALIGQEVVSRLENSHSTPSVVVAARIAEALGVTIDYLVYGGKELDEDAVDKEFCDNYLACDKAAKSRIRIAVYSLIPRWT